MAAKDNPSRVGEISASERLNSTIDEVWKNHRSGLSEEDIPPEYFSLAQMAEQIGKSERTIRDVINRAVAAGDLEARQFRVFFGSGKIGLRYYYRKSSEKADKK